MVSFKRWLGTVMLTSISVAGNAAPQAGEDVAIADVHARLARDDYRGASTALNALTAARLPAKLTSRPDPVLDRLFAEALARSAQPQLALGFATRAAVSAPPAERSRYRLLSAIAHETASEFPLAGQEYGALVSDPTVGFDATLGLARMQMITDSALAVTTLEKMAPGARERAWERNLLLARAATMAGAEAKATAAIEATWAAAPLARAGDAAVARVATDRAIADGRAGDRAGLVALLSVDRLNRGTVNGSRVLGDALPVCGQDGVQPDDQVIIDVVRQPGAVRPRVSLLWANRAAAAAPLLRAATLGDVATLGDGQVAAVGLRCRATASSDYPAVQNIDSVFSDWLARQGVYPITPPDEDNVTTSLASMLAERETRYGPNSLFVVPPLLLIAASTTAEGYSSDEARKRAAAIAERISSILQQNEAPADLMLVARLNVVLLRTGAQLMTPEAAQSAFSDLLVKAAKEPSFSLNLLYGMAIVASSAPTAPAALKEELLTRTLAVFRQRAGAGDPRGKALAIRLIGSKRANRDVPAMNALAREYGIASDQCAVAEITPTFVSSAIVSQDYPVDLLTIMLRGLTALEFSIDSAGAARDARIIVSDPPFAFDIITRERAPTIRYDPARRGGQPIACKGATQNIRWQLPYD